MGRAAKTVSGRKRKAVKGTQGKRRKTRKTAPRAAHIDAQRTLFSVVKEAFSTALSEAWHETVAELQAEGLWPDDKAAPKRRGRPRKV